MNVTHLLLGLILYGVHYPVAHVYVHWTLKGLPEQERQGILLALRPRMRLLLIVWLLAILFCGIALIVTRGSADVVEFIGFSAILGCHGIWWPFVVPIFRRTELELQHRGLERTARAASPVRSAALRPRLTSDYLQPWMRLLTLGVGVIGVTLLTWRLSAYPPEQFRTWLMVVFFTVSALTILVLWSIWVRREIAVSYLAHGFPGAAPGAIESAEALRRFRVTIINWLQIIGASFFLAAAALCIEVDRGALSEQTLGIIGGVGGTVLGFAGGILGIIAGIWTHRVRRQGIAM